MKYIRLNDYQVALVFKNGAYRYMLESGTHWLGWNEDAQVYNLEQAFTAPCDLNILQRDAKLMQKLEVLNVADTQVALLWENGNFKKVLGPGIYAWWKDVVKRSFSLYDLEQLQVPAEIPLSLLAKPELLNYIRVHVVESYERALLFVNGNFESELSPGTYHFWKNAKPVQVFKADMRQQQMEVNGQEILTRDKANLRLNLVAHYKINNLQKAGLQNKEYDKQMYVLLQMAYREFISNLALDELMEKKEEAAVYVKNVVADRFETLGVQLLNTGIRDIILPGDVKDIMNQVLIAEKKAQANIIMRREETASTRSLLNTAKLMEENQMLFKLKEMEYVEKIAEKINSISVTGDNRVLDQLRQIFVSAK